MSNENLNKDTLKIWCGQGEPKNFDAIIITFNIHNNLKMPLLTIIETNIKNYPIIYVYRGQGYFTLNYYVMLKKHFINCINRRSILEKFFFKKMKHELSLEEQDSLIIALKKVTNLL